MRNPKSVLLVGLSALLISSAFAQQSAKGKNAETATTALLHMHSTYQQSSPSQKSQLLTQFRTMAAQRQQLLSSLMQTNPSDVLRIAIPNQIRAAMPGTVQNYVEQTVQAQGVLEVLVEDSTSGSKMHYALTTAAGKLALHFADKAPDLMTGSIVRAVGVQVNADLALTSSPSGTSGSTSLQTISAASAPTAAGAVSTLVILVNFQDAPSAQPWTASSVQNVVFTQTSNWDLENSFQTTSLTGDVAGWFTIPVSSTNCATSTIKSAAQSAAQSAGFNLSSYSHFIYLMSSNTGCSAWWGLATIGGSDVWVNGEYGPAVHVFAHEMGHNFGLNHSHTVDCGTQITCSSGTLTEYGDAFDTMGASTYNAPHFNAFQKERLGWLSGSGQPPITTVTSSGTYQLSPYEAQDSNAKGLKILQSSSTGSYYYLELRQAIGSDSFLSSSTDVMNGLVFHLASPANGNSSDLLDLTPTSPSSFAHPALVVGQTYTDSAAGVTITPTSVTSSGATVQVSYSGTVTCASASPTASVTPLQSAYVTAGTPVNFTITVKDNDSSGCAPATFNLSDTIPSGWTGVWSTSALSMSPGTSATATLSVTSPTGTADGFYNVGMSASNSNSYATTSATATYVINTPAPVSVTVSTNQSTYSSGQTVAIAVSALSGTSPDAGASITVTTSSPNGKTSTQTGTTGSNGAASFSYRLNKRAAPGTYTVRASVPSPSGAAGTTGASTTFTVQ